ncbi:MAG: hypothetical protein U0Q07_02855 [Acidimicrobiales bacterium]
MPRTRPATAAKVPAVTIRLGPITLTVQVTFLVLVAVLGLPLWTRPGLLVAWVLVATVAIVGHELGHAAALVRVGSRPSVRLGVLGGATTGAAPDDRARLLVSVAGPAAGLALGIPVLVARDLLPPGSDARALAGLALWATVGWSLLNLLPVLPLDGGRAATAALSLLAGRDVEVLVGAASVVLGSAVAVITASHGFLGLSAASIAIAAVNAVAVAPAPARRPRASAHPARATHLVG